MVDIKNEAEAAEQMIESIEASQARKVAKHAEQVREVADARAHAQKVAERVAAGDVGSARVAEPVVCDEDANPETEAVAGVRVIDSLLAKSSEREQHRGERLEALEQDVLDEVDAAVRVADDVAAREEHEGFRLIRIDEAFAFLRERLAS